MASIEEIAKAKTQSALERILEQLVTDAEAVKRTNAAKGLLRSGNTIVEVLNLCISCFDKAQEEICVQCRWVIEQSLLANEGLNDRLISDAYTQLQHIVDATQLELRRATEIAGSPNLFGRVQKDLLVARDRAFTNISLFVDGHSKALMNQRIKNVGKILLGWISKLFTGAKKP